MRLEPYFKIAPDRYIYCHPIGISPNQNVTVKGVYLKVLGTRS